MPYSKLSQANPSIRGIKPPVSLSQANAIADMAEGIEPGDVESPWAVAIAQFKKSHKVEDGKWVRKEGSEFGKKTYSLKITNQSGARLKAVLLEQDYGARDKEEPIELNLGLHHGMKAVRTPSGDPMIVLWTTNAFRDREEEIFATQSLVDYVDRADRFGERGRVVFWHVKEWDFADIVWQGVQGRFLLELARPDDTPYGRKMFHSLEHPEEHPELLPQGWGTSHGYVYLPSWKQADGVYLGMHKFESTVLPRHRASNVYGTVINLLSDGGKGIMTQVVSQEKADGLAQLVGPDVAAELLELTKVASAQLEQQGVDWKEWLEARMDEKGDKTAATPPTKPTVAEDEEEEETEGAEEEEEEGAKDAGDADEEVYELELGDDLMREIASQVDVKAQVREAMKEILPAVFQAMQQSVVTSVKEAVLQANMETKEAIVHDAIAGRLRMVPHVASKDADNVVPPEVMAALQGEQQEREKEASGDTGDPVKRLATAMLTGQV